MSDKFYLFIDNESGENFFVETENLDSAWAIVADNFNIDEVEYLDEYSEYESEMLGYDVY